MPADTSTNGRQRRTPRTTVVEDSELDKARRLRGEISCKECRRLKLKCDKEVPCGSCVRRGCASICPNGGLSSGQGTRYILADTEHLHQTISDMASRIRQLEDALAIAYATVSHETHPLLEEDYLRMKFGFENKPNKPASASATGDTSGTADIIDAIGTLTMDSRGEMSYYGPSAGAEVLLFADDAADESDNPHTESAVLHEFPEFTSQYPFMNRRTSPSRTDTIEKLQSMMPPYPRAVELSTIYYRLESYLFPPIHKEELDEILISIYIGAAPPTPNSDLDICSHRLAGVFFVLAIAALFDLSLPPYNSDAQRYYDLGCVALSLRSVFEAPQMTTVQAITSMASYHYLAEKESSRGSVWAMYALAAKLAQGIGLHRDSARWGLDAKTVQRRRSLFWNLVFSDAVQSVIVGRPPTIDLKFADCELPLDEEETLNDKGEIVPSYTRLKYIFIRDVFTPIIEATLAAKTSSYATIMDLDRRIREADFPFATEPIVHPDDPNYHSITHSIRDYCTSQARAISMLYLHRSFFAQAFLDGLNPLNASRSQFLPSCLSAYRASSAVIQASNLQFRRCPEFAIRIWPHLVHILSASIVIGALISRSPNLSTATVGIQELGLAVDIFQKTAVHSSRARAALNVVRKIRHKAILAYEKYTTTPLSMNFANAAQDDIENELGLFGGQTRTLEKKRITPDGIIALHGLDGAVVEYVTTPHYLDSYMQVTHPPPLPSTWLQTPPIQKEPSVSMSGGNQSYSMLLPEYHAPVEISIPAYSPEDDAAESAQSVQTEEVFGRDYESTSALDAQWLSFMHEMGVFDEGPHGA